MEHSGQPPSHGNFTDIHDRVKEAQTIIAWKAPMRPYKQRGKKAMRFFIALALLITIVVMFFGDPILLLPIWSVLFLFYILTITQPPIVENKITLFGIETAGVLVRWDLLETFYFTNRFDFDVLTIVTRPPYSLHTYMVVPDKRVKEEVASILAEHLIYLAKPPRTLTDRIIDTLSHLIPDDEEEQKPVKPKAVVAA
jgi:hypothetical protein